MDMDACRRWVIAHLREQDPARFEGAPDAEVLCSVFADGVDLAEVERWASAGCCRTA